jgi:hypothetical protein
MSPKIAFDSIGIIASTPFEPRASLGAGRPTKSRHVWTKPVADEVGVVDFPSCTPDGVDGRPVFAVQL